jgi:hypothetical protein
VESPHTDDCTFVHIPVEETLFIGDATGGTFPTWKRDPVLARKLAGTIQALDASIFVEGHWTPTTKEDILNDLMEG